MPLVTVDARPKGLPMAIVFWPTSRPSESATVSAGASGSWASSCSCSSARSNDGLTPTTSTGIDASGSAGNVTRTSAPSVRSDEPCSRAPSTTWKLVTRKGSPSNSMRKPLPLDCWSGMSSPKKPSGAAPNGVIVSPRTATLTATTLGPKRSITSTVLSSSASSALGSSNGVMSWAVAFGPMPTATSAAMVTATGATATIRLVWRMSRSFPGIGAGGDV